MMTAEWTLSKNLILSLPWLYLFILSYFRSVCAVFRGCHNVAANYEPVTSANPHIYPPAATKLLLRGRLKVVGHSGPH